jgi:hypothetical protein
MVCFIQVMHVSDISPTGERERERETHMPCSSVYISSYFVHEVSISKVDTLGLELGVV